MKTVNSIKYVVELTFNSLKELEAFYNAKQIIGIGCFDTNMLHSALGSNNHDGGSKEAIEKAFVLSTSIESDKKIFKLLFQNLKKSE